MNVPEPYTHKSLIGADFTITLGELLENGFDLGMDAYPIYDENYRRALNNKIEEHYWFREIGFETPQLFKRYLNRKMAEIMPYYNQVYQSTLLDIDPLSNYHLSTSGTSTSDGTNHGESVTNDKASTASENETENTAESVARTLNSVTPQMQLSGKEDYATSIVDTTSKSGGTGKTTQTGESTGESMGSTDSTANTTGEYANMVSGLSGITGARAISEFRNALINVDLMVIDELSGLFMGLYSDGFDMFGRF